MDPQLIKKRFTEDPFILVKYIPKIIYRKCFTTWCSAYSYYPSESRQGRASIAAIVCLCVVVGTVCQLSGARSFRSMGSGCMVWPDPRRLDKRRLTSGSPQSSLSSSMTIGVATDKPSPRRHCWLTERRPTSAGELGVVVAAIVR
jgi:hypothetical protein